MDYQVIINQHLEDIDNLLVLANQMHIPLDRESANILIVYLHSLLDKNSSINLTAINDFSKGIILHLIDSLTLLYEFDKYKIKSFVDIGSGGGLPAIPLLISNKSVMGIMCESIKKKTDALQQFINELNLKSRTIVVNDRAENLMDILPYQPDCVTCRAVAKMNTLIEYASPLLMKDCCLFIMKGTPDIQELNDANRAAKICGFTLSQSRTFELPNDYGSRTIYTYIKTHEAKIKLPRRIGLAKAKPL